MSPRRSTLSDRRPQFFDRRVLVALVLQVVGYAALLAVYPHSEPSAIVEAVRIVPSPVLVAIALPALPAVALAVLVGAVLVQFGLPPASIPALLLARGDVLFFASAYVVGVASAWLASKRRELT